MWRESGVLARVWRRMRLTLLWSLRMWMRPSGSGWFLSWRCRWMNWGGSCQVRRRATCPGYGSGLRCGRGHWRGVSSTLWHWGICASGWTTLGHWSSGCAARWVLTAFRRFSRAPVPTLRRPGLRRSMMRTLRTGRNCASRRGRRRVELGTRGSPTQAWHWGRNSEGA